MQKITLDYTHIKDFVNENEIYKLQDEISECHKMLHNGTGKGSEYLGWVDLPNSYDKFEVKRIKEVAEKIRNDSDVFIVIGIGGSYLGARAAIKMLKHTFYSDLPDDMRSAPKVYFAGHNMSTRYLKGLLDIIQGKDISINVISKSGTTTEPAIVFRILRDYLEDKYGKEEARKRIYITTDKSKGALKLLSDKEGYETFVIPSDVGGRYSVLTPVGLLPMAVAGIDIDEVLKGGQAAARDLAIDDVYLNHAYQYAAIRNILYEKGKTIEIMASYEPE